MDLSSDSSDDEKNNFSDDEIDSGLDLNTVNECIREYEKMEKREAKLTSKGVPRKERADKVKEVVISPEDLSRIKLTKKQVKELEQKEKKEKKELTLRQKEQLKKLHDDARHRKDLRANKEAPPVTVKIAEPKPRKKKESIQQLEKDVAESKKEKNLGFQRKKPKLEDSESESDSESKVLEEKVNKLNKLNSMLDSNPYYAMIMNSRRR
jgi:hypothetical protein